MPGRVDRFFDARFFAAADLLVAVTDRVQNEWHERCPEVAGKTAVIWNGYDPEEAIGPKPLPQRPYRLISHFGSFYGSRSPEPILSAALRLLRAGTANGTFRFRFVGHIDRAIMAAHGEMFDKLVASGHLELVPPVPHARALDMMMESDSLLLADNNAASIGHTVPAKLFEYVRTGRPIVALTVPGSPVEDILAMSGVRFVTLSGDLPTTVFDARLNEFLQTPTEPVELRPEFLQEFNGRDQARKLAGLIDGVLNARTEEVPNGHTRDRSLVEG